MHGVDVVPRDGVGNEAMTLPYDTKPYMEVSEHTG